MKDLLNPITQRYSKQGLWSLFLMCAFPLHAWTLILVFRDISWLIDRTNLWGAIGEASYSLLYAFVESVAVFVAAALLGFLISTRWDKDRRIALLTTLSLILAAWSILTQLYFLMGVSVPDALVQPLAWNSHPVRILYVIFFIIVTPTILFPTLSVLRSDKTLRTVRGMIESLSLLTTFYLLFDVAGLVIVIIRNIA